MKKKVVIGASTTVLVLILAGLFLFLQQYVFTKKMTEERSYWFILHRKSNVEMLYHGVAGDIEKSKLVKKFSVQTGIPGERPTPLPSLVGKPYWIITEKLDASDNPLTSPYFLTLNIPYTEEEPYGPTPYLECNGQCNWQLPKAFGLHGTGVDHDTILPDDPGSSGCIRHNNNDITYIYNILDLSKEVRYYIQDV
jgi:lipoprotein-anchoring transpeptidase ErfK/SrfK